MGQATFRNGGATVVDYTPSAADIPEGEVVIQANLVGIATRFIGRGTTGGLSVDGVHAVNKQSGVTISAGAIVYWDDTNNYANTTSSGNTRIGLAVANAVPLDATVTVLLNG